MRTENRKRGEGGYYKKEKNGKVLGRGGVTFETNRSPSTPAKHAYLQYFDGVSP